MANTFNSSGLTLSKGAVSSTGYNYNSDMGFEILTSPIGAHCEPEPIVEDNGNSFLAGIEEEIEMDAKFYLKSDDTEVKSLAHYEQVNPLFISASQVKTIINQSAYGKPLDGMRDSVRHALGFPPFYDLSDNTAIKHGLRSEEYAIAVYNRAKGSELLKNEERFFHAQIPWLGATPDMIDEQRVYEVKCPVNYGNYADIRKYVRNYYHQLQCQMHVCGRSEARFIVYYKGHIKWLDMEANPEWWLDVGKPLMSAYQTMQYDIDVLLSDPYSCNDLAEFQTLQLQYLM